MKKIMSMILFLIAGAILMQGFQCASREFSSAKLAMRNNDFVKANEMLEKELTNNPQNQEAWVNLAEVKQKIGDLKGAANTSKRAEKVVKDPKFSSRVRFLQYSLWNASYNKAIFYYNQYVNTKKTDVLDSTIHYIDIAIIIRPEMQEFYKLKGMTYTEMKDDNNAILSYQKYLELIDDELKIGIEKGLYLGIDRADAISKLGKPKSSAGMKSPGADSVITDEITYSGNDLFLFSEETKSGGFNVIGWNYNPPKNWENAERSMLIRMSSAPMANLASIFYNRKDYDNTKKYLKIITTLEPTNSQAGRFLVQIYQDEGKIDEALKSIIELSKSHPKNKFYHAQHGDILLTQGKYDEAIKKYEDALKVDPKFDFVLRNIASAYKNKASIIQSQQQDKMLEDDKYEPDLEAYFPFLRKSAEYFESAREFKQFKEDIDLLGDLINIFEVLDEERKLKHYLGELEDLEMVVTEKLKYYKIMCKVYTRLKITDKAKEACDKFAELSK